MLRWPLPPDCVLSSMAYATPLKERRYIRSLQACFIRRGTEVLLKPYTANFVVAKASVWQDVYGYVPETAVMYSETCAHAKKKPSG